MNINYVFVLFSKSIVSVVLGSTVKNVPSLVRDKSLRNFAIKKIIIYAGHLFIAIYPTLLHGHDIDINNEIFSLPIFFYTRSTLYVHAYCTCTANCTYCCPVFILYFYTHFLTYLTPWNIFDI
jgi:hypothetical protein